MIPARYRFGREGFLYLDVEHDLVAWAAYRGVISSPAEIRELSGSEGFLSLFLAKAFRYRPELLAREIVLEEVRAEIRPDAPSRLTSLFYFPDLKSAEQGLSWARWFRPDLLVSIEVFNRSPCIKLDANWLPNPSSMPSHNDWAHGYWSGEASGTQPAWEGLCDGTLVICGTELRERAAERIERAFPEALALAELSRLSPSIGSYLGTITPFRKRIATGSRVEFLMNFVDADNPDFLDRLGAFLSSGTPVNWKWWKTAPISEDALFRMPDMRRYAYDLPL